MFFISILCAFSGVASGAGFSARLDRAQVVEGDPVVLILSASGDSSGNPDVSALQKDFDLVRQGQSSHMSFINGRSSSTREWHLTLMPRRSGKLTIPPISLGSQTSAPLALNVLEASQAASQGIDRPVMLEVEAKPDDPYVQQKIIYTVRLLHAVPLRDGSLSEPRVTNALVHPLGKENRYETTRNGRQFKVIERRYAILPQRSGPLEIGGPVLAARIPDSGQQQGNALRDRFFGRDPFAGLGGMFGKTRPVQARARDLSVDVKAQPPGASQPWLPAESLTLTEHWSPEASQYRVGEPITRTLVIHATGVSDEQLPEPVFDVPDGINVYPDRAQADTRADPTTLIAQKTIKAAFVPTRAGEVVLPEIRVDWWDLAANAPKVARVPSRRISVSPAAGITGQSGNGSAHPSSQPALVTSPASIADRDLEQQRADAEDTARDASSSGYWPWLTLLFAMAWLLFAGLWWKGWRSGAVEDSEADSTDRRVFPAQSRSRKAILAGVEQACRANDARAARKALLEWAAWRWPDGRVSRLDALAQELGAETSEVFEELDSGLYAQSSAAWNGTEAWRQLAPVLKGVDDGLAPGREDDLLPPLYPN